MEDLSISLDTPYISLTLVTSMQRRPFQDVLRVRYCRSFLHTGA